MGNIVNRVFDSAGPDGKVRGTPQQIIEKYQSLARDAQLSNDRVAAENFLQHSEHYSRMLGEALSQQAEMRQSGEGQQGQRPSGYEGEEPGEQQPQAFEQTQFGQPQSIHEPHERPEPHPFEPTRPQPEMAAFELPFDAEAGELVPTPENPQQVARSRSRGGQNRARKTGAVETAAESTAEVSAAD